MKKIYKRLYWYDWIIILISYLAVNTYYTLEYGFWIVPIIVNAILSLTVAPIVFDWINRKLKQ